MCSLCRDLQPKGCPGCQEDDDIDAELLALEIEDEIYRQIGEPIESS